MKRGGLKMWMMWVDFNYENFKIHNFFVKIGLVIFFNCLKLI